MKYIQGTIGLPLIFSIDKLVNIKWYVDASFAVHKDMSSQSGGFMTMVKVGGLCSFQQTEAEHQEFNWGRYCRGR